MEDPDSDSLQALNEVSTSDCPLAAMEISTSSDLDAAKALSLAAGESQGTLVAAIPSRITGIGEGEIQRLIGDLEELSSSIGQLTQGLKVLRNPLVAVSGSEDPSVTAKCWTKQVRKICYDTGDYLDDFIHSGNEFKLLGARALNATGRHKRYKVGLEAPSKSMVCRLPAPHEDLIDHVHKDMVADVAKLMGTGKELRVVSIVGSEGVGKTTLAKRLYQSTVVNDTECRVFLRASQNADITRLLTCMFMQIQHKKPSCRLNAYELIDSIATYLRNRRYFIIIDDVWTETVWEIISRAFPEGDCGSRIIATTQMKGVALACCGHQSKYVFNMVPLTDAQSRDLFFGIVFGSESNCPGDLAEVSDGIVKKCGHSPFATINIASMLPSELNLEQWTGIRDSLPSTWSTNPTSEWMTEVVNVMYGTLRPHLKTCLLYFSMYPEGYIVRKDDLLKQWVVEGVLDGIEGQATEEVAGDYFDELVRRGMIQPVNTNNNGKVVLSCTLHHTVHYVILKKSREENFVVIADYFQSAIPLPDKARRLSVQFGGARSAYIPESIMVSEVRSLAFFGFLQCFLSAFTVKFGHVRVLILHIWADDDKDAFDLTGIRELLRLRYLKVSCNIAVKLPDEIQGQQYLETLEVHATVVSIPWDIGGLSRLSSLNIAVTKLSTNDIISLQILPALTALSVHVKSAPTGTEMIVLDEGGFLNLKFFTFSCSAPLLLIEEKSMPKIEKLNLCFNAHEARPDGKKAITIEHLESLQEISVKIWGAVADSSSALAEAVTNHPRNHTPKLMESREDQEHWILEQQDEIIEEDVHEYPGTQEKGLGECEITEEDNDDTKDVSSEEDENKDADSRISVPTGSSSRPPVPVGWGIATAGWILSPVFTRLVEKALSHVEPAEWHNNLRKLVTHIIPGLKLTLEAAESNEHEVFFGKLVRDLKSYFYELEEALDEVEYDRLESQLTGLNRRDAGLLSQSGVNESSQKLTESVKKCLTENLRKIEEALEEARDKIKLEKLRSNRRSTQGTLEVKDRQKTTSRVPRVQLIGRDKDLEEITQLLAVDSRATGPSLYDADPSTWREPLSVIGIYGIAGSGKTTLAQAVYRAEKTADNFELCMWIHVSRNYSLRDIFREMLQQVRNHTDTHSEFMYMRVKTFIETGGDDTDSLEMTRTELKHALGIKRFLLVLDDIWCDTDSDKYELYEIFSLLTQVGKKRSKILVTSRDETAISATGHDVQDATIAIHDLSEKDCFELLMYHALRGIMTDVVVKESLKAVGAHIAKRLKGSPLAAALVGGLLHREMTVDHWMSVNDDPYLLKGTMGILWLCFHHLDEQIRRCFAYCSIFPRRHRFDRDELVKLWVAEGFIEAKSAGQMEEIGNYYFGELVSTSFMQLGEKFSNGGKEYFVVHDLLGDIAEQVGGHDFFRIEKGWRGEIPLDVRHLFVQTSNRFLIKDVVNMERLRSLIILIAENSIGLEVFQDICRDMIRIRKLRVLVIETADFTTRWHWGNPFPESFGALKHMRFLAFRLGFTRELHVRDAFTELYHMQVLDFGDRENLRIIGDMGMLTNLRHLKARGQIGNIGRLASLVNLPYFYISKDWGCKLSQLTGLQKLRGKLQVVGLENVKSMDQALEAKLGDKEGLRELVLEWGYGENRVAEKVQADVLEGLCPSEHLEELGITGYEGERYPNWMVVDQHRSWSVQRLVLKKCSLLVTGSSPFFANLLRLTFQDCKWKSLPDHMEHLRKLTVLIIYMCMEIKSLGELPQSLKYLEICGCGYDFMESYKNDEKWNEKTKEIGRKYIGYPRSRGRLPEILQLVFTNPFADLSNTRLQDSSKYPDELSVSSSHTSHHAKESETSTPLPPGKGTFVNLFGLARTNQLFADGVPAGSTEENYEEGQ